MKSSALYEDMMLLWKCPYWKDCLLTVTIHHLSQSVYGSQQRHYVIERSRRFPIPQESVIHYFHLTRLTDMYSYVYVYT